MSDTSHDDHPPAHEPDEAGHAHGHEEHGGHDEHADHDEHGDHGVPLGPVDWAAWGAGIVGAAAGIAVAVCLYVATSL
jgi:hypothetical protein